MGHSSEALYGMGLVGAIIYFVKVAVGFKGVLWGVIKAIFWPGVVLYRILEHFKM